MKIARSFNCGEKPKNQSSSGGAADKIVAGDSVAPPGLVNFMSSRPIFRLPLWDEASRRKPLVEKPNAS